MGAGEELEGTLVCVIGRQCTLAADARRAGTAGCKVFLRASYGAHWSTLSLVLLVL
jgi:hypothetical protein